MLQESFFPSWGPFCSYHHSISARCLGLFVQQWRWGSEACINYDANSCYFWLHGWNTVHTIRFGIIALSSIQHLHHIVLLLHVGKFIRRYCNQNIIIVKLLSFYFVWPLGQLVLVLVCLPHYDAVNSCRLIVFAMPPEQVNVKNDHISNMLSALISHKRKRKDPICLVLHATSKRVSPVSHTVQIRIIVVFLFLGIIYSFTKEERHKCYVQEW